MGAGGDQQHRVAVRLGDLHRHGADDAIGAGAVINDDRLSGFLLDLLADQARGDVAGPSRPNGTMILIGRDGYSAVRATDGIKAAPTSTRTERRSITPNAA